MSACALWREGIAANGFTVPCPFSMTREAKFSPT